MAEALEAASSMAGEREPLATRRENADVAVACEQGTDDVADPVDDMFTVVQHQKDSLSAGNFDEALLQRPARLSHDAESIGDSRHDPVFVEYCGQIAEPGAVSELWAHRASALERHSGLSSTASAGKGYQPLIDEEVDDRLNILGAADQPVGAAREVARPRWARQKRPLRRPQRFGHQLPDADRRGQAVQNVFAEGDQIEPVLEQFGRQPRHQGLTAAGSTHHPGSAVHRRPEIVAAALGRLTRMEPDSDPDLRSVGPGFCTQRHLRIHGGVDGVTGASKCRSERVAAVEKT